MAWLSMLPAHAQAQTAGQKAVGSYLFEAVNSRLEAAAMEISARFVSYVVPIAAIGLTIYIILMGVSVMRGRTATPVMDFAWQTFRIALILSFLVGAGVYGDRVAGTILGVRDAMANVADPSMRSGLLPTLDSISDVLDKKGSEQAAEATRFGFYLSHVVASVLFWLAKVLILLLALIPLLIATVHLYLAIAVGPLAIASLLFPITTKYFDAWLGAVLTAIMTNVAVAVILGFALSIFQHMAARIAPLDLGSANVVSHALDIVIAAILLGYVAWKAADVAAQWVGGASPGNPMGFAASQALGGGVRELASRLSSGRNTIKAN